MNTCIHRKGFITLIITTAVLGLASLLLSKGIIQAIQTHNSAQEGQKMNDNSHLPCIEQWDAGSRYAKLKIYGCPIDMPLNEAIVEFNKYSCDPKEPLLTEEEIIAAIIGSSESDKIVSSSLAARDDFQKITLKRIFPKGAFLNILKDTTRSFNSDEESIVRNAFKSSDITIKRRVIILYRGLDKNPFNGQPLNPDQRLIIRQRYFGFE